MVKREQELHESFLNRHVWSNEVGEAKVLTQLIIVL